METNLIYKELVYDIVGCAIEIYNYLGSGFLEAVYQEAMEIELKNKKIIFEPQKELDIEYKGIILNKHYKPDLLIETKIVCELKVMDRLDKTEESIMLNYLNVTKFKLGLLINFGCKEKLDWKRMVLTY
ncbi:MAG TPA: GxxExxY protein [bacterium]|nr:GxxExxY protein [bacterium]